MSLQFPKTARKSKNGGMTMVALQAVGVAWLASTALPCSAADSTAPQTSNAAPVGTANKAKAQTRRTVKSAVRSDAEPDVVTYGRRDDVMQFGADVAARQGLDVTAVQAALAQSRFVPNVVKAVLPPPAGTAKNWAVYRARFVEAKRIRAGVAFWQANEAWLALAEQRYGVPPEIVVGIIGIETLYGQHMGNFRVVDALATLAFDFPSGRKDRSAFFRDELEQLLVLSHREGSDPLAVKGSYAGALGMPQFMPSSVVLYAIDFDGDGHIDLHKSAADVIGSVAHYLAEFGWQRGVPTHFDVAPPSDAADRAWLLGPDIVPTFTAQQFIDRGAVFGAPSPAAPVVPDAASEPATGRESDEKLALVELQNGPAAPSYIAGTANFYAITRYNWSSYYAMAVIELGQAVKQRR